jgi:hypothetical protein
MSLSLSSIIIGIPVPYPYFTHLRSLICIFLARGLHTHPSWCCFCFLCLFFITGWEARARNTASYLVFESGLSFASTRHGVLFAFLYPFVFGAISKAGEDDGRAERQQWIYRLQVAASLVGWFESLFPAAFSSRLSTQDNTSVGVGRARRARRKGKGSKREGRGVQ